MLTSAFQGIRDEIAVRLNETETDNTDVYSNWIHQGLKDIQYSFPINPFYLTSADKTLSAGTRVYLAWDDFEKMESITYPAGDIKLTYLPKEQFDMLQPSASEGGSPSIYTIRGQGVSAQIEFYESPGSALTLHCNYFRFPGTMSAGSATPDLPSKYTELLVAYGVKQGLRRKGRWTEAREINEEYELLKEKMKLDLMNQTNESPSIKQIRDFQKGTTYSDPIKNMFWSPIN